MGETDPSFPIEGIGHCEPYADAHRLAGASLMGARDAGPFSAGSTARLSEESE